METRESEAMRREPLFSRGGFYGFVVRSNVLFHRQAAAAAQRLAAAVRSRCGAESLRVLDLACGACPVIPAQVMAAFPDVTFHYHGIDINGDQVAGARRYGFPANTASVHVHEGSAWELQAHSFTQPYDLVFMGMNLHHGTPEQVQALLLQLNELLAVHGAFFDHDWFRPPAKASQPLAAPSPTGGDAAATGTDGWREHFCVLVREALLRAGADPQGTDATCRHVLDHDFPISLDDFSRLCTRAGLHGRAVRYARTDPLAEYIAAVVACRDPALLENL